MIIGIDLGTTNSLVSVWRDGKAEVIPNALNQPLTPSVVGLDDEGRIITGQPARERLITHPELTVANIKRYMGSDHEFKLDKQSFRPEELSALVLRSLKADAEALLGEPVTEAVITVPAYFNDSQRKATRAAGELAGFRVERLLNEPTAAALAYGLHHKNDQRYLVFDLGGGTFDVSIVEYFDGVLEVHASAGDNFLGGEDFVDAMIKDFVDNNKSEHPWLAEHTTNPALQQALWRTAEFLKRQLTDHSQAEAGIMYNDRQVNWQIDENRFEKITEPLITRIADPIRRALRDAKFKASDLNEIVMVGGATRMPVIRKLATKLFQRFPAFDIDPDQVVAVGAAIQAGLKARDEALDDTVMTDVCPYSLGIEVSQGEHDNLQPGYFLPIIERNNFIPVSRVETVYTASDRQTRIEVNIYQGESVMVRDNIYLGQLNASVPKAPRGEEAIEVRFTYDINGLLEVEVTIKSTGKKHSKTIEKNPGLLSEEEIRARLKKLERLKIHPRDLLPNQALINRANRIYQEVLGDTRQVLSQGLSDFLAILDRQDDREIRNARKEFEQFLNEIETYTFH